MNEGVEINRRVCAWVPADMVAAIDAFRAEEKMNSRAEALLLLVEIGLDTVSQRGKRFWDKSPAADPAGRPAT